MVYPALISSQLVCQRRWSESGRPNSDCCKKGVWIEMPGCALLLLPMGQTWFLEHSPVPGILGILCENRRVLRHGGSVSPRITHAKWEYILNE